MTGKFQHLMTIQKKHTVDNGYGTGTPTDWKDFHREKFMLKPTQGEEYEQGQQVKSQVTHEAKCHFFRKSIGGNLHAMRLTYQNRIFHVESVVNEREQNRYLVWRLIEVV